MGKGVNNRTTRKLLLGSASALAIGFAFTHGATAAGCGTGSDTTIAAACTAPFDWTGGSLSITSLGTISGPGYGVGVASGSVGEFSNSGVVSAASMSYGLSLSAGASIGKLTNHGTIAGLSAAVYAAGSISTIANSGLLDTPNSGISIADTGVIGTILNQAGATVNASWAHYNFGHVGTFINAGTLTPSRIGINNKTGGIIDVIENTGFINSPDRGIQNNGSIGSITNGAGAQILGTSASGVGISNSPIGTIGTITNNGLIKGVSPGLIRGAGILAAGTITLISNYGTIEGNQAGVAVYLGPSRVNTLFNAATGTIRSTGTQGGLDNYGTIDSALNNGLITGPTYALFNTGSMLLVNAGTIAGNIDNTGTLTISGGSGGTIGTLTGYNGSIGTFTGSGLIFDTGDLLINDTISNGVTVVGTGGNLSNTGSIGTIGGVSVGSLASLEAFTNSGEIAAPTAFYNAGSIGALTNLGTIQGVYGVFNRETIQALDNRGAIHGLGGGTSSAGIYNYGWISTLTNSGTINAPSAPLIQARTGIYNAGSITELTNTGLVSGANFGLNNNSGNIDTITNRGQIIGGVTTAAAIYNSGTIGVLTNEGVVGNINNVDSWTLISNAAAGTIHFIYNDVHGVLTELANRGVIETGVSNVGEITTLTNDGVIRGGTYVAIDNQGVIGALTNNGLITGANALWNASGKTISVINAGTIEGNISNYGSLTIFGGSNGTVGTLTGLNGSIGTFTGSALVFDTGALVLNDVISEGVTVVGMGGSLTNTGSIGTISGVNVGSLASLVSFTNSGSLAASSGIVNAGTTNKIINTETGTIESTGSGYFAGGILNYTGSIGSIENHGLIFAGAGGVAVINAATISALTNWGTIESQGGSAAIINGAGGMGTLDNRGTITGGGSITGGTGTYAAIANSDTITALTNSGKIEGLGVGAAVGNTGSIIVLTNTGAITGRTAIQNEAQIGSILNSGTIKATGPFGLSNTGTIQGFTNSGLLEAGNGLWNWGRIDNLVNAGIINGTTSAGLGNTTGTIGTLSNSGLITGKYSAVGNTGTMSIVNSGTIAGDIANNGQLTISGGSNGVFGTVTGLNGALATVTGNPINFDTGALQLHATFTRTLNVTGSGGTLSNTGTINTLVVTSGGALSTLMNSGTIKTGTAAAIHNPGNIGLISNSGVIDGAITSTSALTFGGNATSGTLTGGIIAAPSVEFASGTVVLEDNIHGDAILTGSTLVVAAGEQIDGQFHQSAGTLDLTNTGIWTITGAAHITGGTVLARNLSPAGNYFAGDSAGTLIDAACGSSYSDLKVRFGGINELIAGPDTSSTDDLRIVYLNDYIGGNLPTLNNTGSIGGGAYGVFVAAGGSIGTFSNSGTIGGSQDAFYNNGTIGLLQNDGIISDGSGVDNAGLILVLTNNGLIEGDAGIHNTGTIGTVVNLGTITGPNFAIDNAGNLGPIANSGTIDGNIRSTSALAISGGTGSTFGILTNGTITADVNFTSGNLRLSDAIVGQASNSGAMLQLASTVFITGTYNQTAGTLDLGTNRLAVSGTARFTGGTINAALSATGNYLTGQNILIDAAAGSSYAGATVSFAPITGLSAAANTASTEDLAITFGNDYIGGSLASLNNTGTLSGAAYGVYVASTGTLGALANSGTIRGTQYAIYSAGTLGTITNTGLISGNIHSAGQLVLAGTGGTLSGGTITASGVSIAGSLRLADNINVGSGTVSAGTASVEFSSKISIAGNYLQTGGILISDVTDTTTYGALAVSGSATITNTTITVNGTSVRSGQTYTLVDAGAASNYTGDTVRLVGAHYRAELSTVGDDLVASIKAMFGEIGAAKGGAAAVMGSVFDRLSDNTALQTMIDRLSLLSDADLGQALEQAAPAEVGSSVASLQRLSLIEDLIGGAVSRHRSAAIGWSVWQEVLGGAAQRSAVSGASGYDTTAAGLVLGVDNRIRENLLVGAALSWSAGWNAGRGDVSGHANGMNSFALTGYGSWTDGVLTVNGRMAIGLDHYNQRRTMTHLDDEAEADYSGQHYVIAADGSYDFDLVPGLTLTPQASLRWLRLAVDGYSETGIGGLTVGSAITDQVQSDLGAKLATTIDTRFGLVVPEIRASWLHDFVNGPGETNAVLGGISFTTTSARISANGIRVGTGLTFYQSDATSLRLEYDGEFRDDYTAHGGMLQLSLGL